MRKLLAVIAAVPLFALVAGATDYSKFETFLGYSFVRFNPNSDFVPSFNANGGDGQFVYNLNRWFGAAVDLGAVTKGTLNHFDVDTTVVNFTAGPRFTYRHFGRFVPFGQVLFGGNYATTSTQIGLNGSPVILPAFLVGLNPTAITARLVASRTGFAMFAGGGLDIKVNKHMSFRPIGADYYLTRVPSLFTGDTTNRNNFRYTAGVNFMFGAR